MLTDRITLSGPEGFDPEDYLSSSLGVIFPDDITNQHGDSDHHVLYASPTFGTIQLALADPEKDDVRLFSHFVWNAGVQLAALIEEGKAWRPLTHGHGEDGMWDVQGKRVIELGAGTGLAGILAARYGAEETIITDYPAPEVVQNIQVNVRSNITGKKFDGKDIRCTVKGHEWGILGTGEEKGELSDEERFAQEEKGTFDTVLVADCLWMPWQHRNLMKSIRWFMKPEGRGWVVAGFHTGRAKMAGFYDETVLAEEGLEIETIWERDADDNERSWVSDRGVEDVTARKRWLVIAVLKQKKRDCR